MRTIPDTRFKVTQSLAERFWSKVYKTDSCWNWFGKQDERGYGRIRIGNTFMFMAYHVSYYLKTGEWIPFGYEPDHTCKNPSCIRWEYGHLECITREEHVRRTSLTHRNRNKKECKFGHSDWSVRPNGTRLCNQCNRDRYHARNLGLTLDEYYTERWVMQNARL